MFTKNRPFPRKDDIKGVMYLKKKNLFKYGHKKSNNIKRILNKNYFSKIKNYFSHVIT